MAASLTPAAGSFNRLVVVPYNPAFVRHGDPMYGTQRLAVMAVDSTRVRHRQLPSLASQSSRVADLRPRPTIVSDAAESVRARIRADRRSLHHSERKEALAPQENPHAVASPAEPLAQLLTPCYLSASESSSRMPRRRLAAAPRGSPASPLAGAACRRPSRRTWMSASATCRAGTPGRGGGAVHTPA